MFSSKRCIAVFIFFISFIVFSKSLEYPFLNWDDDTFVTQNPDIQILDSAHVLKLFKSITSACYAPLSSLSLAIDFYFWNLNPSGYHLTNLILHSLSAALLFWILCKCLSKNCRSSVSNSVLWSAALAAFIFALHPLRVESVVWISERRDVLSVFLGLITIVVYMWYIECSRSRLILFGVLLLLFTACLLSKASSAMLPLMFLWLDVCIYQRIKFPIQFHQLSVLLEKIPFIVLSLICGLYAVSAQVSSGAAPSFRWQGLSSSLATSVVAQIRYLLKWLGFIYPLNPLEIIHDYYSWANLDVWISTIILLTITIALFCYRKRSMLLLISWIVYVVMILPFTGIFKAGDVLTADRYTYLPSVPLALLFGWTHLHLMMKFSRYRFVLILTGLGCLAVLTMRTIEQEKFWRSSESLWELATKIDSRNPYAWGKKGDALIQSKEYQKAVTSFEKAVELMPLNMNAWFDLGVAYGKMSEFEKAKSVYEHILKNSPDHFKARFNLAWTQSQLGRFEDAIENYQMAAKINPQEVIFFNLGICYEALSRSMDAELAYKKAALAGYGDSWINWSALVMKRNFREGLKILEQGISQLNLPRIRLAYAEAVAKSSNINREDRGKAERILLGLDVETAGKSKRVKDCLLLLKNQFN